MPACAQLHKEACEALKCVSQSADHPSHELVQRLILTDGVWDSVSCENSWRLLVDNHASWKEVCDLLQEGNEDSAAKRLTSKYGLAVGLSYPIARMISAACALFAS